MDGVLKKKIFDPTFAKVDKRSLAVRACTHRDEGYTEHLSLSDFCRNFVTSRRTVVFPARLDAAEQQELSCTVGH
jgi:hypothetical protein